MDNLLIIQPQQIRLELTDNRMASCFSLLSVMSGLVMAILWFNTWSPTYMNITTSPAEKMSVLGWRVPSISGSDRKIPSFSNRPGEFLFRKSLAISGVQYSAVQAVISVCAPGIRADPKSPILRMYPFFSSSCTKRFSARIANKIHHQIKSSSTACNLQVNNRLNLTCLIVKS